VVTKCPDVLLKVGSGHVVVSHWSDTLECCWSQCWSMLGGWPKSAHRLRILMVRKTRWLGGWWY
jgi:hypothetical protein